MQTCDRLGYHPERAAEEIAHFHAVLPTAQAAVAALAPGFAQLVDEYAARIENSPLRPADMQAEEQRRMERMERAEKLAAKAGK